jgi:hypothetical protein
MSVAISMSIFCMLVRARVYCPLSCNTNMNVNIKNKMNMNMMMNTSINIDIDIDTDPDSETITDMSMKKKFFRIAPILGYSDLVVGVNVEIASNPISE